MTTTDDSRLVGGHGGQGSDAANMSRLLDTQNFDALKLGNPDATFSEVSQIMNQGSDPLSDEPDTEENPYVPAGYTYLGQFIDHDLTFDTASSLGTNVSNNLPNNNRTPRLDLDCLYGLGPDNQPYMYDAEGRLLLGENGQDLNRSDRDPRARAIIGDPRNDENSIVCQTQIAFIKFHNKLIGHFKSLGNPIPSLFKLAQKEVRLTYQRIVVEDYLRRIIRADVYEPFVNAFNAKAHGQRAGLWKFGDPAEWVPQGIPLEFSGAAYRFGHSMIRNGYRLNQGFQRRIFDTSDDSANSLVGFGPLPADHHIDWRLFYQPALVLPPGQKFDNKQRGWDRLQFAYKIDTTLVDPLLNLPPKIVGDDAKTPFASLIARNLKRGYNFGLPSGQDVAKALGVPTLSTSDLVLALGEVAKVGVRRGETHLADIAPEGQKLVKSTPLWLYILAEAQVGSVKTDADGPNSGTQLGPVGGQILLEVFHGLLDADTESYVNKKATWQPVVPGNTMWDLLVFADAL